MRQWTVADAEVELLNFLVEPRLIWDNDVLETAVETSVTEVAYEQ